MKFSAERKVMREVWIVCLPLARSNAGVGVCERPKAVELVEPVEHDEERVDRQSDGRIRLCPRNHPKPTRACEPKRKRDEEHARQTIQSSSEPREQVQAEGRRDHEQRSAAAVFDPLQLPAEPS